MELKKIIHKFELFPELGETKIISIGPVNDWLMVGLQNGKPHVWAEIVVGGKLEPSVYRIMTVGTGQAFAYQYPTGCFHIGSSIHPDDGLVWHYYVEEIE